MAKDTSQTDRAVAGKETGGNLMELVDRKETTGKVLYLQRKLYRWSIGGDQDFGRLYNLTYNPYFLSLAWYMLKNNNGSRTSGVDNVTLKMVEEEIGANIWLTKIQGSLRNRTYKPDLIRRCFIPKPGKDTMRPLGIPTLEDRLVQMVLKLILEPIFEASFRSCSLGFRPNRGPIHAIAQVQRYMKPGLKYDWVIEADIRDCFGNIDHTILLRRMKGKVKDKRILSLTRSFLKAGVLEDGKVTYPISGSPQGGIISPLLANIYLDQMDEIYDEKYHQTSKYERLLNARDGKPVLRLVRYADDCAPRSCIRDEGRPLGAGLQEQAPNRPELHWLRARVVSVEGKGMAMTMSDEVQGDEEHEPLRRCRKRMDGVKTGGSRYSRISPGRTCLLPGRHPA